MTAVLHPSPLAQICDACPLPSDLAETPFRRRCSVSARLICVHVNACTKSESRKEQVENGRGVRVKAIKISRVGVVLRKMASMEKQKPAHQAQPFRVCAGFHVPHARDACARQSPALSLACVTCSCRLTRPVRRATGLDSIRF